MTLPSLYAQSRVTLNRDQLTGFKQLDRANEHFATDRETASSPSFSSSRKLEISFERGNENGYVTVFLSFFFFSPSSFSPFPIPSRALFPSCLSSGSRPLQQDGGFVWRCIESSCDFRKLGKAIILLVSFPIVSRNTARLDPASSFQEVQGWRVRKCYHLFRRLLAGTFVSSRLWQIWSRVVDFYSIYKRY